MDVDDAHPLGRGPFGEPLTRDLWCNSLKALFRDALNVHPKDARLKGYSITDYNNLAVRLEEAVYEKQTTKKAYVVMMREINHYALQSPDLMELLINKWVDVEDLAAAETVATFFSNLNLKYRKVACKRCSEVEAFKRDIYALSSGDLKYKYECRKCGHEFTGSQRPVADD